MLLCKYLLISLSFILCLFPCSYLLSDTSTEVPIASYFQEKKKIAIFPFENKTVQPYLNESIPDVLSGELFRTGFFEIIKKKKLYKVIWDLNIGSNIKIDNTNSDKRGFTPAQDVDLYSGLNKKSVEKVLSTVGADYIIRGAVNQFGNILRIELDLFGSKLDEVVERLSIEVDSVDDVPLAVKSFVPKLTSVCVRENIEEIANTVVDRFRLGFSTLKVTVLDLENIASFGTGFIYTKSLLLNLYIEQGLSTEAIETCKILISATSEQSNNYMDVLSRIGVDPYRELVNLYEDQGLYDEVVKVCNQAIKNVPFDTSIYYTKLGEILLKQGKAEDAINALLQSINLGVREFMPHYQLAMAYEMVNNIPEALLQYKKCLKYTGGIIKGLPIDEVKSKIEDLSNNSE